MAAKRIIKKKLKQKYFTIPFCLKKEKEEILSLYKE